MKLRWVSWIICIVLGILLWKGYTENKSLKSERNSFKRENAELINEIEHINRENEVLLNDISDFEFQIDSLNKLLKLASNKKTKLVEKVITVKSDNDTIKNLLALNAINNAIIENLDLQLYLKDSIIQKQVLVIQNDDAVKEELLSHLDELNQRIQAYNKDLITERRKKMLWQTIAVGAGLTTLTLIIAI